MPVSTLGHCRWGWLVASALLSRWSCSSRRMAVIAAALPPECRKFGPFLLEYSAQLAGLFTDVPRSRELGRRVAALGRWQLAAGRGERLLAALLLCRARRSQHRTASCVRATLPKT